MHCSTILMLYIIVYLPRAIHCSCQQVVLPKIGNDVWCPTKDNLSKLEKKRHRLLRFRYSNHDSFPRAGIFIQWICSGVDERDLQEVGRARCTFVAVIKFMHYCALHFRILYAFVCIKDVSDNLFLFCFTIYSLSHQFDMFPHKSSLNFACYMRSNVRKWGELISFGDRELRNRPKQVWSFSGVVFSNTHACMGWCA